MRTEQFQNKLIEQNYCGKMSRVILPHLTKIARCRLVVKEIGAALNWTEQKKPLKSPFSFRSRWRNIGARRWSRRFDFFKRWH